MANKSFLYYFFDGSSYHNSLRREWGYDELIPTFFRGLLAAGARRVAQLTPILFRIMLIDHILYAIMQGTF
jgi:hypothetical protein